jgi:hypothetical protein
MRPFRILLVLASVALPAGIAFAQSAPNVSQVLMWSTLTDRPVVASGGFTPSATGTVTRSLFSVYTSTTGNALGDGNAFVAAINNPQNYKVAHSAALSSALGANIALTLSIIPLSSPTSGVILKTDPATGAQLPVSGTLGPIFTQRAETVGKRKLFVGVTHQNYHFTRFNDQKLNGLTVLYGGNDRSGITLGTQTTTTAPATFNLGLDVRLSQDIAFLTYGLTDRFDVSVGLPMVHAAVASSAYNGIVYSGTGTDFSNGSQCWCVNSLSPGSFQLTAPQIGSASKEKTGFGDVLLRFKGSVLERSHASLAVGADLRLPSGEAENYLGTGTTSVKPFAAVSLYSKPLANGIVFAPHFDVGWQFGGKTILGGTLQGTSTNASLSGGVSVPVVGAPFVYTKDYLPDVISWAAGTEVALGNRNTVVLDVIGNQIGIAHSAQMLAMKSISAPAPTSLLPGTSPMKSGLGDAGRGSFGQYSAAIGYKARITRGLVATVQTLIRFDNNGLSARVVPLFGLGYGF